MKNREGVACSVSVMIVLILLLLLLCCSCTKRVYETQYVEQPVYLHDTLRSIIYSHDTTIVKDSVFFAINGDTIVREKNVEKQVEVNRIYWWQKLLMWMGGVGVVVIGIMVNKVVNKKMS